MKRQPKKFEELRARLLRLRKELWQSQDSLDEAVELYRLRPGWREAAVVRLARRQRDHASLLLQKQREVMIRRLVRFYTH